jgi:hypothetical protein
MTCYERRRARAGVIVVALAVLVTAAPAQAREQVTAVLHVHSDLTTGDLPLDEVARVAEASGINAIFLAENYLLRVEYGLPPFRALTRVTREEPSVLGGAGTTRFLELVAATRRQHPRLLIVPGVEVMPHYFWTGSPASLSMTLHNVQKNLLVFGLADPRTLSSLAATGNRQEPRYSWQSLADVTPALLVVPGVVLLGRKRREQRRLGRTVIVVWRRRWGMGLALIGVGIFAVVRGWPFTVDRYPPWQSAGLEPYQTLIDQVDRLGGVTMWSFPEAADTGQRKVGPVQVAWLTEPYADDLLRTFRYTAFGAVYEQPTRFTEPGLGWDRLLGQYARGERSRPAWAVAESGFHGLARGKRLGPVQTVFLVDERSETAVLDAFKRGRLYAVRRPPELALVLSDFSITAATATAASGETLRVPEGARLAVRVAVASSDGSAHPLRVTLVRNGTAVETWAGPTPFTAVHDETFDGAPLVFRVEARGRAPHQLLTNPVFVRKP